MLVERLRDWNNEPSDGPPNRSMNEAADLIEAQAAEIAIAVEALEYIRQRDGKTPDGLTDWQRCVDRIQDVARYALARLRNASDKGDAE